MPPTEKPKEALITKKVAEYLTGLW